MKMIGDQLVADALYAPDPLIVNQHDRTIAAMAESQRRAEAIAVLLDQTRDECFENHEAICELFHAIEELDNMCLRNQYYQISKMDTLVDNVYNRPVAVPRNEWPVFYYNPQDEVLNLPAMNQNHSIVNFLYLCARYNNFPARPILTNASTNMEKIMRYFAFLMTRENADWNPFATGHSWFLGYTENDETLVKELYEDMMLAQDQGGFNRYYLLTPDQKLLINELADPDIRQWSADRQEERHIGANANDSCEQLLVTISTNIVDTMITSTNGGRLIGGIRYDYAAAMIDVNMVNQRIRTVISEFLLTVCRTNVNLFQLKTNLEQKVISTKGYFKKMVYEAIAGLDAMLAGFADAPMSIARYQELSVEFSLPQIYCKPDITVNEFQL
jgi:hypothetical protein